MFRKISDSFLFVPGFLGVNEHYLGEKQNIRKTAGMQSVRQDARGVGQDVFAFFNYLFIHNCKFWKEKRLTINSTRSSFTKDIFGYSLPNLRNRFSFNYRPE